MGIRKGAVGTVGAIFVTKTGLWTTATHEPATYNNKYKEPSVMPRSPNRKGH